MKACGSYSSIRAAWGLMYSLTRWAVHPTAKHISSHENSLTLSQKNPSAQKMPDEGSYSPS